MSLRKQAYGIQITKTQVTLSKTMFHDKHRWKNVEMRSVQIPRTRNDRLLLLEYLELLGTLYFELFNAQEVGRKLPEERVNVNRPSDPLVRSIMDYLDSTIRLGEPSSFLKVIVNKYKSDNLGYEDVLESEDLIKSCYSS
ncbi:hypothetical protein MFLAVUS_008823 [Mucor flavus]|uniref:Uncharacterized protein n=1 Tax=Mucor flavus TaxID=439312 RepID=A0ABP9Z867_9FUNG